MSATTADGWPYVQDADLPVQYPVTSRALADLLEARWDTWDTEGLITPSGSWAGLGALQCTRSGGLVAIEAAVTHTVGLTMAAGQTQTIGTVPVGFRPLAHRSFPVTAWTGTAYSNTVIAAEVQTGGALRAIATANVVLAANTSALSFMTTFRGA